LSDAEREQIQAAAAWRKLTLSGFIRQAALQASAIVEGKATVRTPESEQPDSVDGGLVVLETGPPAGHWVDGELVYRT
jgi:hypothetical protein